MYVKFDERFVRTMGEEGPADEVDASVALLANRWAKRKSTGADAKDLASMCDLDHLIDGFGSLNSNARRGTTTTVDGTPAVRISAHDSKDEYAVYVATEGKPYLLKVIDVKKAKPEHLTFADYDEPVKTAPPAGDVLDLDKLTG
ncbi:hypothetical protein [Streptomyces sp. DSM 118878]